MSDVIIELETLRSAHAELLAQYVTVLENHDVLEKARKRLEQENDLLRAALVAARHRIFGRRSEKLDGIQHELFIEGAEELDQRARQELAETAAAEADESAQQEHKKKRRRRRLSLEDLPRQRQVHEASEQERTCPCCRELMEPFGEEVSERLEYVPAVLRVIEDVRLKYSCPRCHEGVVTAWAPERPIPRVVAGASLLAHIATSKFGYHLPPALSRWQNPISQGLFSDRPAEDPPRTGVGCLFSSDHGDSSP